MRISRSRRISSRTSSPATTTISRGCTRRTARATEIRYYRVLANTSTLVSVVNAALAGVVAGLVVTTAGAGAGLSLVIGAIVTAAIVVLLVYVTMRVMERGRRGLETRFAR